MNTQRYLHYKRALKWIDALDESAIDTETMELLRQTAEDLLLSRARSHETEEMVLQAADILARETPDGDLPRPLADEIVRALRCAGPDATPDPIQAR